MTCAQVGENLTIYPKKLLSIPSRTVIFGTTMVGRFPRSTPLPTDLQPSLGDTLPRPLLAGLHASEYHGPGRIGLGLLGLDVLEIWIPNEVQ